MSADCSAQKQCALSGSIGRAVLHPEQLERAAKLEKDARKRAEELAKKEFEVKQEMGPRGERRRGEIRDGTGRSPLE